MNMQSCVTANNCFPSAINGFIIQEVDRYDNYNINQSSALSSDYKEEVERCQFMAGLICNNQSRLNTEMGDDGTQAIKFTSDNEYKRKIDSNPRL